MRKNLKIKPKLLNEISELRESRKSIDGYLFNFLLNFSQSSELMHWNLSNRIPEKLFLVSCSQYLTSLVSCWETFFRDIFIYVCESQEDIRLELLQLCNIKESEIEKLGNNHEISEFLSKSFNFQNLEDIKISFGRIVGNEFIHYFDSYKFENVFINGHLIKSLNLQHLIPDWEQLLAENLTKRHSIIHDANFRFSATRKEMQKIESTFLLIPQLLVVLLSTKFNYQRLNLNKDGNNIATALISIKELLSDDWEIVDDDDNGPALSYS